MRCSICQREKPETEFHWKTKNVRRSKICKSCQTIYHQKYYQQNKSRLIELAKRRREVHVEEVRKQILQYLKQNPCADCGEDDPIVLDFDHVQGRKEFNIGSAITLGYSLQRIWKEIHKCEVRCANCHRRKTAKAEGWWKTKSM